MKDKIIEKLDEIVEKLGKDFDIVLKKAKDNSVKILYYKPRNLKIKD